MQDENREKLTEEPREVVQWYVRPEGREVVDYYVQPRPCLLYTSDAADE